MNPKPVQGEIEGMRFAPVCYELISREARTEEIRREMVALYEVRQTRPFTADESQKAKMLDQERAYLGFLVMLMKLSGQTENLPHNENQIFPPSPR